MEVWQLSASLYAAPHLGLLALWDIPVVHQPPPPSTKLSVYCTGSLPTPQVCLMQLGQSNSKASPF